MRLTFSLVLIASLAFSSSVMAKPPRPLDVLQTELKKKPADVRLLTEVGKHGTAAAAKILVESPAVQSKPRNVLRGISNLTDSAAAPLLHPLLTHEDKTMRGGIAKQLGKLKNPASAQPLVAMLGKETERRVKQQAVEALGPCASTPDEFRPVLALLDDKDFARAALAGMTQVQEPSLAPLLFPYLKSDNTRIRRAVAKTLGQLGAPEAGTVLLDAIAKDKDRGVVSTATKSLRTAADKRHIPRMMAMLRKDSRPNQSLATALIAVDRVEGFRSLKKFFKKTKKSRDRKVRQLRRTIVNSIHFDPHPSDDVLALALLKSKDDSDRRIAIGALSVVGTPAARDALCRSLHKIRKPQALQGYAATALSKYRDAKTVKCLIDGFSKVKVYSDPSAGPQREIAKSLRTITGQKYEYDVKAWKTWQKAAMNSPESAIEALSHSDPSVRALAAERLSEAKKGKPRAAAIEHLTKALAAEKKSAAKVAFVKALSTLRADDLANLLVPHLTTTNVAEIEAIASALDNRGDGRGTLRLIELLGTSNADKAANALARITGEPPHHSQKRWRKWWGENAERYRK